LKTLLASLAMTGRKTQHNFIEVFYFKGTARRTGKDFLIFNIQYKKVNIKLLVKELAENTFVALKPSPIHGIGVFAIKDITPGVEKYFQSQKKTGSSFRDRRSGNCHAVLLI